MFNFSLRTGGSLDRSLLFELTHVLQKNTEWLRKHFHPNRNEKIDRKARVSSRCHVFCWKESACVFRNGRVHQSCRQICSTKVLRKFLQEIPQKDSRARRRLFLIEADVLPKVPPHSIVGEQVRKQSRDVANFVCFKPVNCDVLFVKHRLETFCKDTVNHAKTLCQQSKKLSVRLLL